MAELSYRDAVIRGIAQEMQRDERVVMIGDSENDINAGRRAGARTCGVTFGFRTAEQLRLSEPDAMIDRFEQLTEAYR